MTPVAHTAPHHPLSTVLTVGREPGRQECGGGVALTMTMSF